MSASSLKVNIGRPAPPLAFGAQWRDRPMSARAVQAASVLVPVALAEIVALGVSRQWARPEGIGAWVLHWSVLAGVAIVVMEAALVVTRRLLPLSVLLRLNLAWPAAAPARFSVALRSGSPRQLHRAIESGPVVSDNETHAAIAMLDLVADLTTHDRATRGHSERVRAYAELIAEELDIPKDDRHRLRWGALLHDIGKLRTPADILNKDGKLTESEFETIKRHPLEGLELAMPLWPWLGEWVLGISDHHERWEGGGYPSGAAGEDIALAGRIIAVADAYDVMTSARSYKAPIPVRDACAELIRCSGTQFDPDVVRGFLGIPTSRLRAIAGPLSLFIPTVAPTARIRQLPHFVHLAAVALVVAGIAGAIAPEAKADAPVDVAAPVASGTGEFRNGTGSATTAPGAGAANRTTPGIDAGADAPDAVPGGLTSDDPDRSPRGAVLVPVGLLPGPAGTGAPRPDGATDPGAPEGEPPGGPEGKPPGAPDGEPPGGPEGKPPRRPAPGSDPVAVVFSPESGAVSIDGLPFGDRTLPVGNLKPIGDAMCGQPGPCDDIVIETPIVLP